MMAHRGEHVAALKLSPEHLGPLEVRITTQDDRTTVWFGATHAETRAALEQALPRLRELFAAQGMQLTDAGVHREPTRNNSRAFSASNREGTAGDDTGAVSATTAVRVGLLDAYA
jgi:flagellar hook-length control protein FliK